MGKRRIDLTAKHTLASVSSGRASTGSHWPFPIGGVMLILMEFDLFCRPSVAPTASVSSKNRQFRQNQGWPRARFMS